MIKIMECEKICLKAEAEKMLHKESSNIYTPKAYLFEEEEVKEWVEIPLEDVPVVEEVATEEDYIAALEKLGVYAYA